MTLTARLFALTVTLFAGWSALVNAQGSAASRYLGRGAGFRAKSMKLQGEIAPIGHDLPRIFASIGAH